jgi:putative membrane protein
MRLSRLTAALLIAASSASTALAAGPTDPQIAHIAYTAGVIDIEAGKLAVQKSKNADVVAFANDMIRDHQAVNDQALALVKKLGVTPEDNDTSKSLTAAADKERKTLAGLDGAAFDKAYIDNEVAYHKTVNGALKDTLIPSASNAELKSLLETGLKIFEGHEQHAEHVAAELK